MITIQKGTWPGWPGGVTIELEEHTAAAILTAVRDYQVESRRNLHGDILALPAGGLRLPAWVLEMQWGFDYGAHGVHAATATAAQRAQSNAIYTKYNMDRASRARPAMNTHTLGICGDIADNGFLAWLKTGNTAARYGLRFTLLNLNDLRHVQFIPGLATVALDVTGLNNTTKDMDMITRRLVRQTNTPGVYYAVNNILSPVISPAHLDGIIADMHGLQSAGDAFLAQAGAAAFNVIEVADLRLAGIVPATAADLSTVDFNPSDADIEKIVAGLVAAQPPLPSAADIAAAVDAAQKDDFAALAAAVAAIATQAGKTPAEVVALLGKSIANG